MRMKARLLAAASLLAAAGFGVSFAQQAAAPGNGETAERKADEQAIRESAQRFARAFEKGDAKVIADAFTAEGEYVDEDKAPLRGRAALEKAYLTFFSKRPEIKVELKTDAVRFLGKDTAVEEGTFTVRAKDQPANTSRYSCLHVRQDGRWLIAMLKEWGDDKANQPRVEDLAWLIGAWETDRPDLAARTTYEWTDNNKFIRCRFTIINKKDPKASSSGTQIIGLDPAVDHIRSWTFDSEGGIGEASWSHDGERWVIHSHGSLAGGSQTSAVNFLTRTGKDSFTWRSVQRTVEGEPQPDIPTVRVTRVAKAGEASPR
jgi:uncharacterized protein (TIGR02246 family)